MTPETIAMVAIIVAAGSELIALIPSIRANSWIQLILSALRTAFPKKY